MNREERQHFVKSLEAFLKDYSVAHKVKQQLEEEVLRQTSEPYDPGTEPPLHKLHQELNDWHQEWGEVTKQLHALGEKFWPEKTADHDTFTEAEMDDMFQQYTHNKGARAEAGQKDLRGSQVEISTEAAQMLSENVPVEKPHATFKDMLQNIRQNLHQMKPRRPG